MKSISVEHIFKKYRYGALGSGSFRKDMQSWWAKFRNQEDPNSLVDEEHVLRSELASGEGDKFWALNDVSFELDQGDILGIVGRNGAGKSTLLKILSRVTAPTSGTVRMKGRAVSLLEVGTGFHPELTGRENVYLSGMIQGMPRKEITKRLDEIVEFAEVEKFIDTPVKRYSSGMYVRLGFAVAAHLQAEILILDEVLAVGDTKFQRKCQKKMIDVGGEGRTILYVSHNLNSVLSLCNKAIHLKKGNLIGSGTASSIVNDYLKSFSDSNYGFQLQNADNTFIITRIRILDEKGIPSHIFSLYADIQVEVSYEALKNMGKLTFSIGISGTGGAIGMASMLYDNKKSNIQIGKGKVVCRFKKLPLMPGQNYALYMNVRAPDNETSVIPTTDIASFEIAGNLKSIGYSGVLAAQTGKVSGPVILTYDWHHLKE